MNAAILRGRRSRDQSRRRDWTADVAHGSARHARTRAAQFSSVVVVAVFFSVSASVFVFCFVFLSKVKKFRVRSDNFIAIDRRLTVVVTDCPVK